MPYNIRRLSLHTPGQHVYFFDANIWLLILGFESQPDAKQLKYINFFQGVLQLDALILLPAQLVSEVINRMLQAEMRKFAKRRGDQIDITYFKQVYRREPEFRTTMQKIYDDFNIYVKSCSLINDQFGNDKFGFSDLFTLTGPIMEFNDHYFLKLAKAYDAIIVTDDGDFFVEDVQVLTLNNTLLNKANAKVISTS